MPLNAPDLLSRLSNARTTAQVDAIMAGLPIVPPEQYQWLSDTERAGSWQPGNLHWLPVGRDRGNGGRIKLAGEPMNPLAERLVNGMEALIELSRLREIAKNPAAPMPPTPREAVLRYFGFPRLDQIERLDDDERKAKSVMRTWARACTIIPEFVGHNFEVHNGNKFLKVFITEDMVGHKLGEFAPTRAFRGHSGAKKTA